MYDASSFHPSISIPSSFPSLPHPRRPSHDLFTTPTLPLRDHSLNPKSSSVEPGYQHTVVHLEEHISRYSTFTHRITDNYMRSAVFVADVNTYKKWLTALMKSWSITVSRFMTATAYSWLFRLRSETPLTTEPPSKYDKYSGEYVCNWSPPDFLQNVSELLICDMLLNRLLTDSQSCCVAVEFWLQERGVFSFISK